jgi:hypothetical protein
LPGLQFGLVLEQTIQDVRGIVERAWDHDAMEAGELIAGEIVVGDPTLHMEIFAVVTSVEGAHRNHEPESIRRGDLAATPRLCQGNVGLSLDQTGVRANQGFSSDVVLLHPS